VAVGAQAAAQVTFYESENFAGRTFTAQRQIGNLQQYGFNDRISSVRLVSNSARLDDNRYGPPAVYDARRRGNERRRRASRSLGCDLQLRGREHRVQMAAPPGRSVTVNEQGEPRA
jgi:hypothetical protein